MNKLKKFKEDKDLLGIDESSGKLNNLLMEASKEIYQSSEKNSKEKSKENSEDIKNDSKKSSEENSEKK